MYVYVASARDWEVQEFFHFLSNFSFVVDNMYVAFDSTILYDV